MKAPGISFPRRFAHALHSLSLALGRVLFVLSAATVLAILAVRHPWPSFDGWRDFPAEAGAGALRQERSVSERVARLPGALPADQVAATGLWHLRSVRAQEAWTLLAQRPAPAGPPVLVGVCDGMLDPRHPDLAAATGPGVLGDPIRYFLRWLVGDNHGSAVMGLVAGQGLPGMTGVAPQARLIPYGVLDDNEDILVSLQYFQRQKARIANYSVAAGWPLMTQEAVDAAHRDGLLVVTGLPNWNIEAYTYPALHRRTLVVSGVGPDDEVNARGWGPLVDVVAPAPDGVLTPAARVYLGPFGFGALYRGLCCNSAAVAIVSGVAALLLQSDPTLTPAQIEKRLRLSARKPASMTDDAGGPVKWHPRYGYGVVDAYAALTYDRRGPQPQITAAERRDSTLLIRGTVVDAADDNGLHPTRERDNHLRAVPISNIDRVEYRIGEGAWQSIVLQPLPQQFPESPQEYVRNFDFAVVDTRQVPEPVSLRAWDTAGNIGEAVTFLPNRGD